jgi:hypothetical protein
LLPEPLSNKTWWREHIIEPLRLVGLTGTADDLQDMVMKAERQGYRILLKTGTLQELEPPPGSLRQSYENELLLFVVGKWEQDHFVPGLTLAGVLHLQDSKPVSRHEWIRTEVARPILRHLLEDLAIKENATRVAQEAHLIK